MMPPLTVFQQLLMQGRGTAPQQGQPQAPQPAPAPAPAVAKPSRLDGLLRRYDQFATGGADPSALNPQQRSLMRRQLAMNIGGAIQQGQPIAAGVSAHGANLVASQEAQLKQREAQQAMARQQAVQAIFAQQNGGGGQMPLGGQGEGGEPMSPVERRMAEREAATRQYQQLLAAGAFEDADKFSEQMQRVYPELNLEQVNTGPNIQMVDSRTGTPVAAYDTNPTDYQMANLGIQQQRLGIAQQLADRAASLDAGPSDAPITKRDPVTGELFYLRGRNWERIPAGAGAGGAGGDGLGGNDRQQAGRAMARRAMLEYASNLTKIPPEELSAMTKEQLQEAIQTKGRRTLQGPVLGRIPLLSNIANADVAPYATAGAAGQALENNPVGVLATPDFTVAERQMPSPGMPLPTQARIIANTLFPEGAGGGVGNLPAPGRTITRTGKTKDGRRVVEYSDGTREIQ